MKKDIQSAPLLAFYGDDFTGSADAMEVLQWSGLRTVLFPQPPTREQLQRFDNLAAFGVAGMSRVMTPAEMESELRPQLEQLRDSGVACVHYKTCSTFDSSPGIGSIGKALEIGREVFHAGVVPIVIAAPNLGRYQVFGNLFARSGLDTEPFRLDRHPTMSRHPITPMNEADIRMHLAAQTDVPIGLVDCLALAQLTQPESVRELMQRVDGDGLLFDALYPEHMPRVGQALQSFIDQANSGEAAKPCFLLGSSGVEYALTDYWAESGLLPELQSHAAGRPTFGPTKQLIVITGSCSPVNARQIDWAERNGFETVALNSARLLSPEASENEMQLSIQHVVQRLRAGANVILHSSRGPGDERVAQTLAAMAAMGFDEQQIKLHSGRALGPKLGRMLAEILAQYPLKRVGVAGGDTSGYIARELGLTALEPIAPVAPGSPLCHGYADNQLDGVEFFFKGGQVGNDNVWQTMLEGTRAG